ncbi:hypothetical protein DLAC_10923 [Tieghemostelium lacteum]|uniref:Uncharacterized protein n=1 Tax=Tieghemostelium lacteum TaxID=361077 RepID=A0A151Z2R6_TIELA|nr:hypothetical protein DLAC_10923 [Tieghemostelium lacteum]|eukprot:KYQ88238.1 hypothetical protein DLAC_10923 [Tieghemostelium lacteum]
MGITASKDNNDKLQIKIEQNTNEGVFKAVVTPERSKFLSYLKSNQEFHAILQQHPTLVYSFEELDYFTINLQAPDIKTINDVVYKLNRIYNEFLLSAQTVSKA